MNKPEHQSGAIFESYKDGTFVDLSLEQIVADKTVMFVSLPQTHDYIHHGYVKYLKSLLPYVDNICLVSTGSRFNIVKMATYWPEFVPLWDKNLEFAQLLQKQINKKVKDSADLKEWKYQCVFKNKQLNGFYETSVEDVRSWIADRLKNDATWKAFLKEQDKEVIKSLRFLINKPEYFYISAPFFYMRPSLAPLIHFDKLWPNKEIERSLKNVELQS